MKKSELKIEALDGFELSALLLEPIERSKGVIQFHPGTLARKEFYLEFCSYLTEQGYTVVLFDYRGIGQSRPQSLKGFQASITDWGVLDMPAVLNWIHKEYRRKKKFIVAHSMGGQVLGLMGNHHLLDGIVTIASSYGNWRNYSGMYKYQAALLWVIYFPVALSIFGYLPLKKLGMGEDLPKGAAKELWDWCKKNIPHSELMRMNNIENYYNKITRPIKAYFIEDDKVATAKTILQYQSDFSNADLDIEIIRPHNVNSNKIGHYGFFQSRYKEGLWIKLVEWLNNMI